MIDIFISHSSEDAAIAEVLTHLLRAAINIPPDRIRCTSVDGYRLPIGASTEEQLRKEVFDAKAFIGLITTSSLQSTYVLFELGARWGAGLHLAPLLAAGANTSILRGPLIGLSALNCGNPKQVHQLVGDIARILSVTPNNPSSYEKEANLLVRRSNARMRVLREQASREERPTGSIAHLALPDLFLAGCGVGNRVALFPVPGGVPDASLDEFLGALQRLGIRDQGIFKPLVRARNIFAELPDPENPEPARAFEAFFDAINRVPEVVRARCSKEDFVWFKLGQLLYEVATLTLVQRLAPDAAEVNMSSITALELFIESNPLPPPLKAELTSFVETAHSRDEWASLYEYANHIALSVHASL